MKKILLFVFSFSFLLCFVGCDKIEEDQYWVYAGANGTWYDTDEEVPTVQNAFVEKYTGVKCKNCPTADEVLHAALEKYGDRLTVLAVHAGPFGVPYTGDEDLRTDDGHVWYEYFGISGQPAALLMRGKSGSAWDIFTPTSNFDDKIDAIINAEPTISIKAKAVPEENGVHAVDIYVAFEKDVADELTLTVLLMEDHLHTTQMIPSGEKVENYEQNHVLRAIITDPWGIDVTTGAAGDKRTIRLPFEMNEKWNTDNCHVVAFVSEKESRKILNVTQTQL